MDISNLGYKAANKRNLHNALRDIFIANDIEYNLRLQKLTEDIKFEISDFFNKELELTKTDTKEAYLLLFEQQEIQKPNQAVGPAYKFKSFSVSIR